MKVTMQRRGDVKALFSFSMMFCKARMKVCGSHLVRPTSIEGIAFTFHRCFHHAPFPSLRGSVENIPSFDLVSSRQHSASAVGMI